jgi:triosephosphate isomerase
MSRNYLIAGNWKMNLTPDESEKLIMDIIEGCAEVSNESVDILVCPSFIHIPDVTTLSAETEIFIGAQNVHSMPNGAYTGEISAQMLSEWGVNFCIVGHSERRQHFGETDGIVNAKVKILLQEMIAPIVCVGETLLERKAGQQEQVVKTQLAGALHDLSAEQMDNVVIAYEPVWAIGTGETATPEQAQAMHAYIRSVLADLYDPETAEAVLILYGGSMKPDNASELLRCPDVDGGLIGGASLQASSFLAIVQAATALTS